MGDSRYDEAPLSAIADFRNGKGLFADLYASTGKYPVFGANGQIARTNELLNEDPVVVIGRVGAYCGSVHAAFEPSWVTDNAIVARPKPGADVRYLYYRLKSLDLRATATGSAQPLVTQGGLAGLRAHHAPLTEQRAIAHILGTLDDKIELNRRMNDTLEAMARALFKSWFVDFDPVRAKAEGRQPSGMDAETAKLFPSEFVESELGEIPKGWSVIPLYDAATYVNGAAYAAFQPNADRRGLPIVKIAELKAGLTAQTKFSDVAMPEKYRLATGDVLFSWSGNPDTSIDTFVWTHGAAWLNQHIFRVAPRSDEERSWILSTLKYLRPVFAEIARDKQTTGLGHVTAGDMKRLLVVQPEPAIMRAWGTIAGPLLARAFQCDTESQQLSSVRDELLPRLLSGELSACHDPRVAEAVA